MQQQLKDVRKSNSFSYTNYANWETAGYRLAAKKSYSIGSVHRLVYLLMLVLEAFSDARIVMILDNSTKLETLRVLLQKCEMP